MEKTATTKREYTKPEVTDLSVEELDELRRDVLARAYRLILSPDWCEDSANERNSDENTTC